MDTAVFETFGKYKLTERLAFGGMAEVFLATVHGEAGFIKPVVIKRLHPRLNEDAEFVQMLIDEARITAQLNHSNICQVLDLGSVDNAYYLAMEFISGEDVRTLQDHCIRNGTELSIETVVYLMTEVLAGLDYAHRKEGADGHPMRIIHRDISPQNILISYEGEVKIIDFGIAKARSRLVQTEAGVIKGKFRYMSPEQASGGTIDHRTDVFAAGVMLYELLRGEPHSLDVADTEVLRRMRRAEFEPLRNYRADLPPTLERLVKKALSVKPSGRFASAGQFRDALLEFLEKLNVRFGRSELATMMKGVFDQDRRRRRSGSYSGPKNPRDPHMGTPHVALPPDLPTVAASGTTGATSKADGWVAFAPTRASDTGEQLPPTNPLEGLPTDAIDGLPTKETAMPPMSTPDAARGGASRPAFHGEVAATQAWYSLSDSDIVDEGQSVPTAQRSQPRLAPGIRQPRADLHRQPTDILGREGEIDDSAPTQTANEPYRQPVAHDDVSTRAAGGPHLGPPPSDATGFFANQAETRADPKRRATGGAEPRGRPPLRTLVGIGAVVLVGLILAVVLMLTDRPLDIEERPVPTYQRDYGLRVGVQDQGPEAAAGASAVHVQSQPSGARIILCGEDTGQVTPAEVPAEAGQTCDLELELEGYDSYSMPVTPQVGRPITIVAALRRASTSGRRDRRRRRRSSRPRRRSLGGKGILRVTSIQVGTVYVNNKPAGSTPRLDVRLTPGSYQVRVYFSNLSRYSRTHSVTIARGQTSRVHVEPPR